MKIEVTKLSQSNKSMSVLTLSHGDEDLSWDVSTYDRATFADIETVFDCINDFWKTLPAERLTGIWNTYKEIHRALRASRDVFQLNQVLQLLVQKLYSYMPYEELRYWVNYKADVKIPSNVLVDYAPSAGTRSMPVYKQPEIDPDGPVKLPSITPMDLNYPKELTYLRKDYQELAVLSVALRPMVPIWGEYIRLTEDQVGGSFKEYEAMGLLYLTELPQTEAMNRLLLYMEHSVAIQPTSHSAIMGGLSVTTLPSWLLAGCLVRRLVFGQIHAQDEKTSIVANVYRYVNSTMKSLDSNFDGKVNPKKLPMEMNEDDNSSLADMYKVKQDVADAKIVALNIYATERLYDMAARVDPSMPTVMVDDCLAFINTISHLPIRRHQTALAQWIIAPAISPRSVEYLNKKAVMHVLAVTQAALWHWGFFELAAILTAIERPIREVSIQWGSESRSRISKELVDELTVVYPHVRRQRGKDKSVRQLNTGYRAIDLYCEFITQSEWQLNAPAPIAEKVESVGASRLLVIPPDLRMMLAQLILRLAGEFR
jgi:hypothetical protein